jgi:hypothetical protein
MDLHEQMGEETRVVQGNQVLEEGDGKQRIPMGQQVPNKSIIMVK